MFKRITIVISVSTISLTRKRLVYLLSTSMNVRHIDKFGVFSFNQVRSGFKGVAVMTDDKSTMSSIEEDLENIGILHIDPALEPYKDHFKYRLKRYVDQKKLIEEYEGGLEEFAKGDSNCLQCPTSVFLFCTSMHTKLR